LQSESSECESSESEPSFLVSTTRASAAPERRHRMQAPPAAESNRARSHRASCKRVLLVQANRIERARTAPRVSAICWCKQIESSVLTPRPLSPPPASSTASPSTLCITAESNRALSCRSAALSLSSSQQSCLSAGLPPNACVPSSLNASSPGGPGARAVRSKPRKVVGSSPTMPRLGRAPPRLAVGAATGILLCSLSLSLSRQEPARGMRFP
jgi:hypothetical protein